MRDPSAAPSGGAEGRVPDDPDTRPAPAGRRERRLNWWLLPKILVSGGILYYLLSTIPIAEIAGALRGVDPLYVVLGFAVVPLSGLAAAAQQKVLTDLQGLRLSILRIAEVNLVVRFYDLFLPSTVGSVIRWRRFSTPARRPAEALATLAFHRGLETLVMLALGLFFWFLARPPDVSPLVSGALIVGLALLLAAQVGLFNRRFAALVTRALEARPARVLPAVVRSKIGKVAKAAGVFERLSTRGVAYMVGLSVARRLLGVLGFVWLARAVHLELAFAVAGWIDAFLAILLSLPISIAGLGVREASLVVFLQSYGVSAADALALSFLLLARKLVRAGLGGLAEARRAFLAGGRRVPGSAGAAGHPAGAEGRHA